MEIVIGIIVAIVLLIFLTGKKRRANTISKEIYSLIRSGQNKNILHHIYFEAALKFALEHGGELERGERAYDATSISFKMNIDGTNYFIYFAKNSDGSTYLGIDDADEMQKEFRERINLTNLTQRDGIEDVELETDECYEATNSIKSSEGQQCSKNIDFHKLEPLLKKLIKLKQDKDIIAIMEQSSLGMPISALDNARVQEINKLLHQLSEETGQTLEELFDEGGWEDLLNQFSQFIQGDVNLDGLRLIDFIKKENIGTDAGFINIYRDLGEQVPLSGNPVLLMAHAYALRTAAAGLFLQGIFDREAYDEASNMFKGMQLHTGQTVEFQEAAANEAYELLASYDARLTKEAIIVMTSMVEFDKESKLNVGNGKKHIPYELVLTGIQQIVAIKATTN